LEKGKITYSRHGDERKQEREITTLDIEHLIRHGRMVGMRANPKFPGPSYTIKGLSLDNEKLTCAVAIQGDLLLVITVHPSR
jgi:hypothetical protein